MGPGFLQPGPVWSNATKKCQFQPFINIVISTFLCSIFCLVTNYDLNFDINTVLHFDMIIQHIPFHFKAGPCLVNLGPGWSMKWYILHRKIQMQITFDAVCPCRRLSAVSLFKDVHGACLTMIHHK